MIDLNEGRDLVALAEDIRNEYFCEYGGLVEDLVYAIRKSPL